jgi:hypothetical protein
MAKQLEWEPQWIDRIMESLRGIEYGSVQIVIHDGRIVQIERTERRRFDASSAVQKGHSMKGG